jgi:phytoene synthase
MFKLYEKSAIDCSRKVTNNYSTSFSLGIKMISSDYRWAIYSIYGFVRLADEIVDTFEREDKAELLAQFKKDTYESIEIGISLNPILHAFQKAANEFKIGKDLIEPFFISMESDLDKQTYSRGQYDEYIYGSAEVVGLMCLKVFCDGNLDEYNSLVKPAKALGAAFQKVNFLRDMKSDVEERGRVYFPKLDINNFNEEIKQEIIEEVKQDFELAYSGIKRLPLSCRFGVYTAYRYYLRLLDKIDRVNAKDVLEKRIRVANSEKVALLARSYVKFRLNVL